ncbi:MAG: toxic anion resistance protein [Gammaproteobacteria bacterium]
MSATETAVSGGLGLNLDVETVKNELALADPSADDASPVDPELDKRAEEYARMIVDFDPNDSQSVDERVTAVEDMGRDLQRDAAHRSRMLQQPIKELAAHGDEGSPVAQALVDLKLQVEDLDPHRFDFEPGWFSRLLGTLPGIGGPIKRYFSKFESAQTIIDAIIRSLENGRDQLRRDNVTLREDQGQMRSLTGKLERQIALARALDGKLSYKLERDVPADDSRHRFIQEEVLFPLRQRIMDLQQQLAVNQQGVLSTAILMRNNTELVRGVDRALDLTVSALQVAVTTALGLANQKIVLDKVTALNATTSTLIANTAAQLRTQGTAIHKQASGATLEMDSLKSAFSDINQAMDEIARFRTEALPQMAQTILEFDEMTAAGEQSIRKLEEGARAGKQIRLEPPPADDPA